jgi:hypothetical protein
MIILKKNTGRLGNAIFRLFAIIIFCTAYNDTNPTILNYNEANYREPIVINDVYFNNFLDVFIKNKQVYMLDTNSVLLFDGYYQHDQIYVSNKQKIVDFIRSRPDLILETDRKEKYLATNIIDFDLPLSKHHDIVVHLRLEDFIDISLVMNPDTIKIILEDLGREFPEETIAVVVNNPTTELERKYICYLTKNLAKFKIVSNDVITDFTIMRKAKILVCSCSTLSWAASLLSDTLERVYVPDLKTRSIHETFSKPIANTVNYKFEKCTREELIKIVG